MAARARQPAGSAMMDKTFDPAAVEARIAEAWEVEGAFKAGRPDRREAAPFTIVIPPPNVTGSLHMGHALNNTLQDILCRFERMRGRDVLWQPGMDHAGIATQMVVERQLMEQQIQRRQLGREEFVRRVWEWKEVSGGRIQSQLKRLGASCDWSRERFTMDEGLSRAVLKVFVSLYEQGLMYKDKRLVNWDPKFQTAISDLEVEQVEVKGHLWHIRYPIAGEPDRFITVATTRPETMLGDVAIAVHPDDDRFRTSSGTTRSCRSSADAFPSWRTNTPIPRRGPGCEDHACARLQRFRRGAASRPAPDQCPRRRGRAQLKDNAAFLDGLPGSETLRRRHGPRRARPQRRAQAHRRDAGGARRPAWPSSPISTPSARRSIERGHRALSHGSMVPQREAPRRAGARAVRDGRTTFVPENWEKTYFQWLENIEPWCVSRQLWWGHQIPAWYDEDGNTYVALSEEEALAQARDARGRTSPCAGTRTFSTPGSRPPCGRSRLSGGRRTRRRCGATTRRTSW